MVGTVLLKVGHKSEIACTWGETPRVSRRIWSRGSIRCADPLRDTVCATRSSSHAVASRVCVCVCVPRIVVHSVRQPAKASSDCSLSGNSRNKNSGTDLPHDTRVHIKYCDAVTFATIIRELATVVSASRRAASLYPSSSRFHAATSPRRVDLLIPRDPGIFAAQKKCSHFSHKRIITILTLFITRCFR